MADYVSNLTGEQMNDALQQMNERLPEQWATGKIDGEEVTETNPRYHNNAKYYAESASEAVQEVTGMAVAAHALPAGSNPTVTKSGGGGTPVGLDFGIPRGTDAAITQTEYQVGTSGTVVPTGTWQTTIPGVPQGQFLWTRYAWNDGTYTYQVYRQPVDGDGAGDMLKADYDSDNAVRTAGGIKAFFEQGFNQLGLSVVDGKLCITYEGV